MRSRSTARQQNRSYWPVYAHNITAGVAAEMRAKVAAEEDEEDELEDIKDNEDNDINEEEDENDDEDFQFGRKRNQSNSSSSLRSDNEDVGTGRFKLG